MSGETKLVNESLFAFNNQILAMNNVVKKAKINIIQKLIRKIKLLSNKKGNEAELAKNKRKSENLKHEIQSVKKAKLNDIAILAFDNDGVKYEEFMKKNPKISADEVAVARVAFHKLVEDSIDKIKKDPKLEGGWKKIFIQFKSRNEKRKNWKEKQKLVKIIEEKLEAKNENDEEAEEDETATEAADTAVKADTEDAKPQTVKSDKISKKEKKKEAKKEIPVDSDGQDDEETAAYNPEEDEEELDGDRAVAFSDDESEGSLPDFGISFGEDENFNTGSDASAKKKPKRELKPVPLPEPKRNLKPLVVENKPTRMVIKQINLDELQDLDEIPIESNQVAADDDETVAPADEVQDAEMDFDEQTYAREKTIKATEDPFFLDQDGKEIQDVHNLTERNNAIYYNNRFNKPRYRKDEDEFDYNFDEKEQFIQKRSSLNSSSFKSSLSSRGGRNNGYGRTERPYNRNGFDSHRGRGNSFRPSNDRGDFQRNKRPFDNSRPSNGRSQSFADTKPSVDLAKNHPSWLAKKQQEEKLKNQKFEGKKITFDD